MRLPPLPTLQEIIRMYGLSARKKLSQNFLLDLNLTKKIVRMAGKLENGIIVEVGPGPGGITRPILNANPNRVIVIEKDKRFIPSLQILAEASNHLLEVVHDDVLSVNLQAFLPDDYKKDWEASPPNIHIIGNLPFSISTPLIIKWLHKISTKSDAWSFGRTPLTLTFQKEVAERIVAPPESEYRCRLSIMCQYLCDVQLKFTIPGKAFVPPPKVDVGVVKFVPKKEPLIKQPFPLVEKINRHLFHMPNKYCSRPISTLFPLQREDLCCDMFELTGLNPQARPFELSIADIKKVCDAYAKIIEKEPDIYTYDFRSRQGAKERRRATEMVTRSLEEQILKEGTNGLDSDKDQYADFDSSSVNR